MEPVAFGRRAILKKEGADDVRVEVSRTGQANFSTIENGIATGVIWARYTPEQLMKADTAPMTLDDAWRTLLSKYPDYSVTDVEDSFPVESAK
jgi:hypothetical protein